MFRAHLPSPNKNFQLRQWILTENPDTARPRAPPLERRSIRGPAAQFLQNTIKQEQEKQPES